MHCRMLSLDASVVMPMQKPSKTRITKVTYQYYVLCSQFVVVQYILNPTVILIPP